MFQSVTLYILKGPSWNTFDSLCTPIENQPQISLGPTIPMRTDVCLVKSQDAHFSVKSETLDLYLMIIPLHIGEQTNC